jgi:hypothetical protein
VFRQIIGIQVDTNCVSFIVDIVIRVWIPIDGYNPKRQF